jgi:methylmalonyl-CoA mutase N-terminal domain/subunit
VLGGTQSLHTNSKDEALALPTEESVLIALRTQQIVAHESGVTNTIDPLGGSYFVEQLTDRLEAEAERYIQTVDDMGGMVTAIEQGWVQKQIEESAYRYGRSIEDGERIVVGVNEYQLGQEPEIETFRVPRETASRQIENLTRTKAGRDRGKVDRALARIEAAARGNENLMPPIIDAVRVCASNGEICRALQEVFGEYEETFH